MMIQCISNSDQMYSLERTFTSCVALGKLPVFSVPSFLRHGIGMLMSTLQRLNELVHVKHEEL